MKDPFKMKANKKITFGESKQHKSLAPTTDDRAGSEAREGSSRKGKP